MVNMPKKNKINIIKPEYGIEIASNKLTSLTNNSGSIKNVVVEEIRSEIFTNFTYQISKIFSIKSGLTSEFSQIEVFGELPNKQSFRFIKPSLTANYKINKKHQLTFVAERKVGQLNFRDFADSSDATEN